MDIIRGCYLSQSKLFRDSDATSEIRWFRCEPGAKPFPYEHNFGSQVWQNQKDYPEPPIGEQWLPKRIYDRGKNKDGYAGRCFIGETEWFQKGAPISIMGQPAPDVPCCKARQSVLEFFLELLGKAWVRYRRLMDLRFILNLSGFAFLEPEGGGHLFHRLRLKCLLTSSLNRGGEAKFVLTISAAVSVAYARTGLLQFSTYINLHLRWKINMGGCLCGWKYRSQSLDEAWYPVAVHEENIQNDPTEHMRFDTGAVMFIPFAIPSPVRIDKLMVSANTEIPNPDGALIRIALYTNAADNRVYPGDLVEDTELFLLVEGSGKKLTDDLTWDLEPGLYWLMMAWNDDSGTLDCIQWPYPFEDGGHVAGGLLGNNGDINGTGPGPTHPDYYAGYFARFVDFEDELPTTWPELPDVRVATLLGVNGIDVYPNFSMPFVQYHLTEPIP